MAAPKSPQRSMDPGRRKTRGAKAEYSEPRLQRRPVWSGAFTDALAMRIPVDARPLALAVIKGLHTLIFASVGACIGLFVWGGLRQATPRHGTIALWVALAETAVYVSNNQVCPLTPLAEELGAKHGSVADIYLPNWVARQIPLFGGGALLLGMALRLRSWTARRR
jgi:hypothetical protein